MGEPDRQLEHPTPKNIFLAEVNYWARKIGVEPKEIRVRKLTNKWGSRSAHGRVSFNSELLWQPPSFRKQEIVAQLLRLKVPGEGDEFASLLESYLEE
jgi:hypothetical protein